MSKTFNIMTVAVSARPRSKRLREAGGYYGGGSSSSSSGGNPGSSGSIPTEDINKGVMAYSWGPHAAAGYFKTAADIVTALGYVPASNSENGLQRPTLRIVKGWEQDGSSFRQMPETLYASHPLMEANISAEFVLMLYRTRRGKFQDYDHGLPAYHRYRKCWGEARGKLATNSPLTFAGTITTSAVKLHILHNYVCIEGAAQPSSMTLAQFEALSGADVRFGGLHNYTGYAFKDKTKGSELFGIAVRYPNPAFAALVNGELAETTRAINDANHNLVPRYIYTDVAPIRVHVGTGEMGFDLRPW